MNSGTFETYCVGKVNYARWTDDLVFHVAAVCAIDSDRHNLGLPRYTRDRR